MSDNTSKMMRWMLEAIRAVVVCLIVFVEPAAAEDTADAFVTVSSTLGARWPTSDEALISLMKDTGLTRQGRFLQWVGSDSSGTLTVIAVPDGNFAVITFEPHRKQELAAGLFEALTSVSMDKVFNGPDELSLKFKGTAEQAAWSDEVLLRLPRGVWVKTVRTLTVQRRKP